MKSSTLVISSEFPPGPGGIGQHAYSLVKALVANNFDTVLMSPADYAENKEVEEFDTKQSFQIIRFKRFGTLKTYFNRIFIVYRFIKNNRIENVILTGKFSLWLGLFIQYIFPKIKTIAILHGSEVNLKNKYLRKLTHHSINAANEIVSVSAFTKSLLPPFILANRNIHIIPNGIELEEIRAEIDNEKIVLIGKPCLLTVGHISPRKGQHRVVKALPYLIEKYPNIHYHMVGTPNTKSAIELLANQLGVLAHITFHNRVKQHHELIHYYNASDIFMLLSENQSDGDVEGFGIVALEANLAGKPVIGAKNCGIEDAINNDESGYLVDGNNAVEIEKAISNCLLNMDRLKTGAMNWANQHNWLNIVNKYIPLLNA